MAKKEFYEKYFERVDALSKDKRIAFKRCCGKNVSDIDAGLLVTLFGILPNGVEEWEYNKWLFATCIHCLWDANLGNRIGVSEAIARLKNSDSNALSESFEKRILALMDTEWDECGFMSDKYLNLVRMLKQKGYVIDGAEVLDDVIKWNSNTRTIQKKWAKKLTGYVEKEEE